MLKIPHDCPRQRKDCIALANIISDGEPTTFFCCGENNGKTRYVKQDKFTICFKGPHRDEFSHNDKRDLVHSASVILQALAVIEKAHEDDRDWSAWKDL